MKLVGLPASPFVRKALIVAAEVGLTNRVTLEEAAETPLDAAGGPRQANPIRKVPFLELAEGRVVYDSLVVCLALLEEAPDQTLLPAAGPAKIDCLTREALSRGLSDAAIAALYETRYRPEEKVWPDWIEGQWRKVASALDAMEAAIPPEGRFDLGDCGWASSLSHLDFRFAERNWRRDWPKIAAWFDGVATRPSVARVI